MEGKHDDHYIKYATICDEEYMEIDGVKVFQRVGCEFIIDFHADEESMAYMAKNIVKTLTQCRKAALNEEISEGEAE